MSSPFPWRPEARQRVHDRCRDRRAADQHRAEMSVLRLPDGSALSDRDKHARMTSIPISTDAPSTNVSCNHRRRTGNQSNASAKTDPAITGSSRIHASATGSSLTSTIAPRRPITPAGPRRRHEDQAGKPHLQESRHGERQVEQVFHPIFPRFPGPMVRLSASSGQQSVGVCHRARPPGAWSVSLIPAS